MRDFKESVKNDDTGAILLHISFPLKRIKNEKEFKLRYAELFNEKVKAAVASQRLDRIFRSARGAMIGKGELWFNDDKGTYKLIAINPE
jgi:hypothetical protein